MKHILLILITILPIIGFTQTLLTFSGQVIDNKTGKIINDASVWVENKQIGTLSDENGTFLLYLPQGSHRITFTANGFDEKTIEIMLIENTDQQFNLKPVEKFSKRNIRNSKITTNDKPVVMDETIISENTQKFTINETYQPVK